MPGVLGADPHGVSPARSPMSGPQEVQALMPVGRPFDGFVEYTKRVSPTCLVHLERNRYSVPASFANRPVSLRVYPDRVVVAAEGQVICEHHRIIDRSHDGRGKRSMTGATTWLWFSASPVPCATARPSPNCPRRSGRLQQQLLGRPGGDREMVEILALVLQHDEQAVLVAVEMALEAGVPTKTHVLNLLHRLVDGKTTPPVHRSRPRP